MKSTARRMSKTPAPRMCTATLAMVVAAMAYAGEEWFPFVVPANCLVTNATDFSAEVPKPAGAQGFVTIRDGHFYLGDQRWKIWGVNLCFGATVPPKELAPTLAARMAQFGINAVRFHHHDSAPAPRGILRRGADGRWEMDPEMVERLDYFLDQLHRHGIYANLNLHVGRNYAEEDGPEIARALPYECRYSKYVLYFVPAMRERLKRFIREYLDHVNPYRGLRRAEDPAIAVLELTNENSFSLRGPRLALELPAPYREEFRRQFNVWLARRYPNDEAWRAAWLANQPPPGPVVARLQSPEDWAAGWRVSAPRGERTHIRWLEPVPGLGPVLTIEPASSTRQMAHSELQCPNLSVVEGRTYTIEFHIRSDRPRQVQVDVSRQGPDSWSAVGWSERLGVSNVWRHVRRSFRATATLERGARICFKFGDTNLPFQIAGLVFREGGVGPEVIQGQSVERRTVQIPDGSLPGQAEDDARAFMEDVEREFIREMIAFLRHDLRARMPITASQITYHGAAIVADTCDYVDIHAYWQHPRFPGRPWDPRNWLIANTPMEAAAGRDVLSERATWRLLDRPFTLSEWNIPAPHDMAASTVPFAALMAARQDWDGVFFFTYSNSGEEWNRDTLGGYFGFIGHPVKLATLGLFRHLFVRGDLPPLANVVAGTVSQRPPAALSLQARLGIITSSAPSAAASNPVPARLASPDKMVVWDAADSSRAHVIVNTHATRAVWGMVGRRTFELGGWKLSVGSVDRDYALVGLTSLDGRPLESASRMLLVAVGRAENQGMQWNAERTSVGNQWGRGPTIVNGVPIHCELEGRIEAVYVLDPKGDRRDRVPVTQAEGRSLWSVGPECRTIWYELLRAP